MSERDQLRPDLTLPVIAAPMFMVSTADLVVACCTAGVIGAFPGHNGRTPEALEAILKDVKGRLAAYKDEHPGAPVAPFGVNLIIHGTNPRAAADLGLCVKYEVPVVITSLGNPTPAIDAVHGYGGLVFSDVTTVAHARKAAGAGVDGLILVCAGAGGHAGPLNPCAFVPAVRAFFDGILVVAGGISDGRAIRACEVLGADLAYMGTRFLATAESGAAQGHKDAVVNGGPEDLVFTPVVTGVPAYFIRASLEAAGYDLSDPDRPKLALDMAKSDDVWRAAWSAGQGLGAIHDVPTVNELVQRLKAEYDAG